MIKAGAKTFHGESLLFLALSGADVTQLAAGERIRVSPEDLEKLGLPPMVIVLGYGRTDADILANLKADGIVHGEALDGPV
jgi:hypothetical protein